MEKIIYVDHSATTSLKKEVLDEMIPYLKQYYGNPSSSYLLGQKSKKAIEDSREKIANILNAKSEGEIYFTSGGSEADNMIILGIAYANRHKGNHIITTKIEHSAVLNTCKRLEEEGFEVTYLDADKNGIISIYDLQNAIKDTTILISVMFANNEIGTIQPIEEIGKIARFKDIIFHTDAVQAIGNLKIDVEKMCIDALSASAHKFYGPKGVGFAYIKDGIRFIPLINGGHQEKGKRAGTENVASIVGMAKAFDIANKNVQIYYEKLLSLRNYFIDKIKEQIPNVVINGSLEKRLPGNVNIYIPKIECKTLLTIFDMNKIYASSGSACNSNISAPSHVLKAIGLTDYIASNCLRITFGEENTKSDVDFIIDTILKNKN